MLGHEEVVLGIDEIGLELGDDLFARRDGQAGEHRRPGEVQRQDTLQLDERLDVLTCRPPDRQLGARNDAERSWRRLARGMQVLLAEVEAEPRVDQARVRRRHQDVVVRTLLADPLCRGGRVQPADDLGRLGGVPRRLDPHVLAPGRIRLGDPDEEARDPASTNGNPGRRRCIGEEGLDLRAGGRRRFVHGVQRRLGGPVLAMPLGEQRGGGIEIARGERPNPECLTGAGHDQRIVSGGAAPTDD